MTAAVHAADTLDSAAVQAAAAGGGEVLAAAAAAVAVGGDCDLGRRIDAVSLYLESPVVEANMKKLQHLYYFFLYSLVSCVLLDGAMMRRWLPGDPCCSAAADCCCCSRCCCCWPLERFGGSESGEILPGGRRGPACTERLKGNFLMLGLIEVLFVIFMHIDLGYKMSLEMADDIF